MTSGFQTRKLSGFEIQWRVVKALVFRELRRRVGEVNGGFFFVLLEPLGAIAVWTAFLTFIRGFNMAGLNTILFLTSGMITFTVFSIVSIRGLRTLEANYALFFYRRVKPIDTLIASAICESGLYACCLLVILPLVWFNLDMIVMQDFSLFVVCFLMSASMGFSLSLVYMVLSSYVPNLRTAAPWINRALWFVSGVPFVYLFLPQFIRKLLLFNPLLHIIELGRHAMSSSYPVPEVNLQYPAIFAISSLSFSLWLYSKYEKELIRR